MEQEKYQVLLYYEFVPIEDKETFSRDHLAFCKALGLKGRILVADKGIKGTVSGTNKQTKAYMEAMKADERCEQMFFKIDEQKGHADNNMHIRPREELITLRVENPTDTNVITGEYLDPNEFYEAMQQE